MRRWFQTGVAATVLVLSGCIVEGRCSSDAECGSGRICENERCQEGCRLSRDCPSGHVCVDRVCILDSADGDADSDIDCSVEVDCPDDMVPACGICIDIHEASRPDATETSEGVDTTMAVSKAGVRPWTNMSVTEAQAACEAAGKRLCTAEEWVRACRGPADTDYPYGDTYEPETCNGIDTFGRGNQRLLPTGAFEECVNGYGVFDISGNVWEIGDDGLNWVHGGAYNCIDSRSLHLCDYSQSFSAERQNNVGFRCCRDGI